MADQPTMDDLLRRITELERKPQSHGCICPPGSEATCQGVMCPRRPLSQISSSQVRSYPVNTQISRGDTTTDISSENVATGVVTNNRIRPYPKHPGVMSSKSGAFNLSNGDRFVYDIDGRHGWADEFLPDGDALVCWDDGTYGMARWNHMSPEFLVG